MEKKMSKKKKILLGILVAVVIALLVVAIGYIRGWFDKGYDADVVTVSQRNVTSTFETSGTVSSASEGKFTATAGIKVKKVNVKVGSVVKKGDVLATFDTSTLESTLSEKQQSLNKAEKAYKEYKTGVADSKTQLADLNKKIAEAEKKVAQLEKESKDAENEANNKEVQSEATEAKANLSKITDDSTLAGKIVNGIINLSPSLKEMKESLEAVSSMSSGYDISEIMSSMSGSSSQYSLIQAQLELATLKASKTMAETQSNGSLESVYKSVYEATLKAYNETKANIDTLKNGWIAENDGIVSAVDIKAGETVSLDGTKSASTFDVSSIVSSVVSGGDVSEIISGFFAESSKGITVQYYPLEINITLNKGDLDQVFVGQSVNVKSETGKDLKGEVTFVSAIATASSGIDISSLMGGSSSSSGGIEATVSVSEPDNGIIIGLDADISIDVEEKQKCITVPVESIQYDDSNAYVYVYNAKEGTISQRTVETGIFDGTYYEILSGVKAGEIIVRTPSATMADGDKVVAHNVD